MAELGEGTLSDHVRIWLPGKVETELPEHRRRMAGEFSWGRKGPPSPGRAAETILLGDTRIGDDLAFHPDRPDELFVLPRHSDQIHEVGPGLDPAIEWLCGSGVLTRKIQARYFEPPGDRERVERMIPLPYDPVRNALLELDLHDLVGFEERAEDEERVFTRKKKVGDRYVEVDDEEATIMLLVEEFGGDVTATSGGITDEPDATEVMITHVPGAKGPKLDRLVGRLDDLEGRARKKKRRRFW